MNGMGAASRWVLGFGVSIALHAVVLRLMFSLGREPAEEASGPEEMPGEAKPVAVSQSAPTPEPIKETPPVLNETKPVPPPVAAPKPVVVETPVRAEKPTPPKQKEPPAAKAEKEQPAKSAAGDVYVVRRGDTLTKIADAAGVTQAELAKINGTSVKKLSNLKVGQKIRLRPKNEKAK